MAVESADIILVTETIRPGVVTFSIGHGHRAGAAVLSFSGAPPYN